ncbi:unnamed protein product [Chrysoparadoxa australica]
MVDALQRALRTLAGEKGLDTEAVSVLTLLGVKQQEAAALALCLGQSNERVRLLEEELRLSHEARRAQETDITELTRQCDAQQYELLSKEAEALELREKVEKLSSDLRCQLDQSKEKETELGSLKQQHEAVLTQLVQAQDGLEEQMVMMQKLEGSLEQRSSEAIQLKDERELVGLTAQQLGQKLEKSERELELLKASAEKRQHLLERASSELHETVETLREVKQERDMLAAAASTNTETETALAKVKELEEDKAVVERALLEQLGRAEDELRIERRRRQELEASCALAGIKGLRQHRQDAGPGGQVELSKMRESASNSDSSTSLSHTDLKLLEGLVEEHGRPRDTVAADYFDDDLALLSDTSMHSASTGMPSHRQHHHQQQQEEGEKRGVPSQAPGLLELASLSLDRL